MAHEFRRVLQVTTLLLAYISDFLSHTDLTDYTEDSCLAGNINLTQNTQNSQKASRCALAGLHRGCFYRTQINFVESRLRSLSWHEICRGFHGRLHRKECSQRSPCET